MTRVQRIPRKSVKHWLGRKTNASSSVLRNLRIWTVRMSHTTVMFCKWKSNPTGYYSHGTWLLHGMKGNSLLPFDRMVSEQKQCHWINQGKQCATLIFCPSVFHRLTRTAWEKGGKMPTPSNTLRHGGCHLKFPIQKLTHKPSSFVPWMW